MGLGEKVAQLEQEVARNRREVELLQQVRALLAGPALIEASLDWTDDGPGQLAEWEAGLHAVLDEVGAPVRHSALARIRALAEMAQSVVAGLGRPGALSNPTAVLAESPPGDCRAGAVGGGVVGSLPAPTPTADVIRGHSND